MTKKILLEAQQVCKEFKTPPKESSLYDFLERVIFRKNNRWAGNNAKRRSLENIHFTIHAGDFIGLIGGNGAGKTTLCRILSGAMKPTKGKVVSHTAVIPVLDVAVGVHGDLNGYANFFPEGTSLGWRFRALRSQFHQILEFSGLGGDFYKPMKFFSAGMLTRFTLSIALERDIGLFLLDEVLGAGDAQFRSQVIEKLKSKAEQGSAIFLVSHNLKLVESLCNRVLVLKEGKLIFDGDPKQALDAYRKNA